MYSWYNGNLEVARDPTLFAEKVGPRQHLKCIYYCPIKKVIIPIKCTLRSHCLKKVEIVQSSPAYTFIHLFVPKSQMMKNLHCINIHISLYFLMINDWYYLSWSSTDTQTLYNCILWSPIKFTFSVHCMTFQNLSY